MARAKKSIPVESKQPKSKSDAQLLKNPKSECDTSNERAKRIEFWKSEIENLKQAQFGSLEEALESIVDKAISKFTRTPDKDMKAVLCQLLLSDPEIVETVKTTLKLR